MMGTWGQSISGTNGSLYQLRALDWVRCLRWPARRPRVVDTAPHPRQGTDTPLQQYPLLLVRAASAAQLLARSLSRAQVYHPSEANSNKMAVLTWVGFIGAITGMSSAPFGVCEKVRSSFTALYRCLAVAEPSRATPSGVLMADASVDRPGLGRLHWLQEPLGHAVALCAPRHSAGDVRHLPACPCPPSLSWRRCAV